MSLKSNETGRDFTVPNKTIDQEALAGQRGKIDLPDAPLRTPTTEMPEKLRSGLAQPDSLKCLSLHIQCSAICPGWERRPTVLIYSARESERGPLLRHDLLRIIARSLPIGPSGVARIFLGSPPFRLQDAWTEPLLPDSWTLEGLRLDYECSGVGARGQSQASGVNRQGNGVRAMAGIGVCRRNGLVENRHTEIAAVRRTRVKCG